MACSVSCLSTYGCLVPNAPENEAILAPFVELSFLGGAQVLTVGNNSAPPINRAAITSFEYGFHATGGLEINVEITDEGGSMYKQILKVLNKSQTTAYSDTLGCTCKFGWIKKDCNGTTSIFTNETENGEKLYFMPKDVKANINGGAVKIKFTGTGICDRMSEQRQVTNFGDESNKISLKQALRQLFTERDPKVGQVVFQNKDKNGEFKFKSSDGSNGDGPKAVWTADQQNAISVARKWISSLTTENDLGILILYDNSNSTKIIFQEDPNSKGSCCNGSVGTYIVNGGNCSNVLSFNPEINWILSGNTGGGGATAGASSGGSKEMKPDNGEKREQTGVQTSVCIQQNEWMWRSPEDHAIKAAKADDAHEQATNPYEMAKSIQAELKIQGDPRYPSPNFIVGQWCSIVVINPFYLKNKDNCQWLSTSTCNNILSNKKWFIQGVNHQINSGSFTTTIKVFLAAPNVDINADAPIGGCGNETIDAPSAKPKN